MAEQKIKKLARNLSQVKKISSDVNINTYYKEIKPFLFGNSSPKPIKHSDLPSAGGIYKIAKFGKMKPGNKAIIKVAGKSAKEYKIAKVSSTEFIENLQKDEHGNRTKNPAEYFFPSDLVRVLTGLAQVFYKSKYNISELSQFASGSSSQLDFVKKWGQVDTEPKLLEIDIGYFYEEKLERLNSGNVKKLLNAVINAAIEFENIKERPDLAKFDPKSEIVNKIIKDIVPKIFEKFIDTRPEALKENKDFFEKVVQPILEADSNFIKENADDFEEELSKKIENSISDISLEFFRDLFSTKNLKEFAENYHNYDPEIKYFLFTTRQSDGLDGIKESGDIYSNFINKSIDKFLKNEDVKEYTIKYIHPLFKKDDSTTASDDDADTEEGGESNILEEELELESPISFEDFKKRFSDQTLQEISKFLLDEFIPNAFEKDLDDDLDKNISFSYYKNRIKEDWFSQVEDSIKLKIEELILSDFSIEGSERTELVNQKLFALDNFEENVFESEWYKDLLSQSINYIKREPSPDPKFASYFDYLYNQFIAQAILILQNTTSEQEDAEEDIEVAEIDSDLTNATVPRHIPGLPTDNISITKDQINSLSPNEIRALQYESAWMYNRAVYELFTSNGIKRQDIDPEVLLNLQSNIFNYASLINERDFNKLFGSSSARQKALLDFYQKSGYGINKFQNAQELLGATLKKSFNLDNPVLTENIKNTIDGLIVQYGLNQDFYAFDKEQQKVIQYSGTNKHDIIWFIENIPPDRLALIFNLPSRFFIEDKETQQRLKEALKSYAQYRASELSLHIQSNSLQNGLMVISDEDAEKIKNGDEETIAKHLSFTKELRNISKDQGGDTLAGAIDERKDSNRVEIQKQFKTFIPLWNQLTGAEQLIIYEHFGKGHLKPQEFDGNIDHLEFIAEFIFFDVKQFGKIKDIIERINSKTKKPLTQKEKDEVIVISQIQDQYLREKKLSKFLNQEHKNESTPEENVQIIEHHDGRNLNNISFRETVIFDQQVETGNQKKQGRLRKFFSRKNNKFKKLRKAETALKKATSKTAKKLAGKAANKAAGKAISGVATKALGLVPGVGTALSAILLAAKNKHVRNFLIASVVLIITFIVGAASWLIKGGAKLISNSIGNLFFGNSLKKSGAALKKQVSKLSVEESEVITRTNKVTTFSKLATSYTGLSVIAAGGFSIMIVGMTLFTILIIQSAFLIPIPKDIKRKTTYTCDTSIPKPSNDGVILSADGLYAYPLIDSPGSDECFHWDGTLAIDIYSGQAVSTDPQKNIPIVSYTRGTIVQIDNSPSENGLGGLSVFIKGDDNRFYYYAHMCIEYVDVGDVVEVGEVIGVTGQSGINASVTPEHLHFAIQEGGVVPWFFDGGNICPFTDIREKFSKASCPTQELECVVH